MKPISRIQEAPRDPLTSKSNGRCKHPAPESLTAPLCHTAGSAPTSSGLSSAVRLSPRPGAGDHRSRPSFLPTHPCRPAAQGTIRGGGRPNLCAPTQRWESSAAARRGRSRAYGIRKPVPSEVPATPGLGLAALSSPGLHPHRPAAAWPGPVRPRSSSSSARPGSRRRFPSRAGPAPRGWRSPVAAPPPVPVRADGAVARVRDPAPRERAPAPRAPPPPPPEP